MDDRWMPWAAALPALPLDARGLKPAEEEETAGNDFIVNSAKLNPEIEGL